ncbi:14696_t:CDS:10 [Funneliformis mosseae]|uniref:14696_t:CDS:1 n=1 Tax=Funneliformis mosseae TaxID=27381 RepID=A0A9N9ANZ0_FUNMO|nr:14696_t:CDS:10 [Funneliformis mosseae]
MGCRTVILLDCHPETQTRVKEQEESSNIPSFPLWTCFTEATLEYCRVVFDLFDSSTGASPVSVHIAGAPLRLRVLNEWHEQNLMQIADNVKLISPYSVSPSPTRLPHALENAIKVLEVNKSDDKLVDNIRAKVILILMGKAEEPGYSYRETHDQKLIDLRDMIYEALKSERLQRLQQYHFDVLRVMPSYELIEKDIPWAKINTPNLSAEISITLYNIPPGRRCLTRSMLHLAQLHLNLNNLRLLEVPMKKSNNTKSSYEVNLLYPAGNHTPHNVSTKISKKRIYEIGHLNDRQIVLKWVQRLHGLDQLATSCTHMVTPTEISPPTRALMSSLMKGAIYALADAHEISNIGSNSGIQNENGKSTSFSHLILFRQDALYLHCQHINHGQNVHLEDAMYFSNIPPKISTMFQKRRGQLIQTTSNLDIETRWLSLLNTTGIKLQIDLSADNPVSEIISQLKDLLCVDIPRNDGVKIINEILDRLLMMGRRSEKFQNQKSAISFLRQLTSIAENLQSSSPMHEDICDVILARIKPDGTENKQAQISHDTSNVSEPSSEPLVLLKEESKETQGTWQQFDQLNSMTYRERQDMLDGQDLSHLSHQQAHIPNHIRNRIPPHRGKGFNQVLGGRRPRGYHSFGKTETPSRDNGDIIRHPPAPYLRIKPVDDKMIAQEKDDNMKILKNPKSLLYQYWSAKRKDKFKGTCRKDFDGRLPSSEQNRD